MPRSVVFTLLVLGTSLQLFSQGRVVMMNTWADAGASKEGDRNETAAPKADAAYFRALNQIDSLEAVVLQLKRQLSESEREREALLNYNRELVQGGLQAARQEREEAVSKAIDQEAIIDAITFEDCMEASSFQPLFSELIEVKYNLNKNNNTFMGELHHTYTPEIGQRETRVQKINGTFERTRDNLTLHITEIDLIPTDVTFSVHDRSYKSFIKVGPEAAVLPYTKVVNFEELSLGYCLF